MKKEHTPATEFEKMLMWTSYRYCIGRKSYVVTMADELCDNLCGVGPGSVGVTADCVRKHFLVIGNIYDNPDLIKREDD